MQISFPTSAAHDPLSGGIIIPVVVDNEITKCKVTKECLDNKFYAGPQPEDRLATYRGHRVEIQTAIARKLKSLERLGGVTISATDFNE